MDNQSTPVEKANLEKWVRFVALQSKLDEITEVYGVPEQVLWDLLGMQIAYQCAEDKHVLIQADPNIEEMVREFFKRGEALRPIFVRVNPEKDKGK